MTSENQSGTVSKKKLWTGRIMSIIVILFLLFDGITKLIVVEEAVNGTVQLGYPESTVQVIGLILLVCLIIYIVPRTSVFGAILLTGFLGGAVATQLRIGNPLFSNILFPVYLGILLWGGIFLRDNKLKGIISLKSKT